MNSVAEESLLKSWMHDLKIKGIQLKAFILLYSIHVDRRMYSQLRHKIDQQLPIPRMIPNGLTRIKRKSTLFHTTSYVYMYLWDCVCVWESEREREREREPIRWGIRVASEPLHVNCERLLGMKASNGVLCPQSTDESPNTYIAMAGDVET